jgi:hypothetical protein
MVGAAKGNGELVADAATQRVRLGKSQVVGIRWRAPAHKAGLRGYELQVRTIAVAARFAQREDAFVDMPGNSIIHTLFRPRAWERRAVVILRRRRRCRHPPPATSFHGGRHQFGKLVFGQLRGGGTRLIGGRRRRPSRNGR